MAEIVGNAPVLGDVEDFLAGQESRYEFVNGRIVAMTGGSERHNDIPMNLAVAIGSRLRRGPYTNPLKS
jgi:Uma2 family endonuclease